LSEGWATGPERPTLAEGEVHVWRAELNGPWPGPEGLPAPERERAAAFLHEDAVGRWVASRWALRLVLARYRDEPAAEIALELGENDKPQLADPSSGLRFNLSHSGDLALVAVTQGREVGVDVEEIEPARDLLVLAERALAPAAVAEIRAAAPADQPRAFYRAWTRHEARLKCLGIGLGGTDPGDPVSIANLDVASGYAAAVAVTGEVGTLRCWSHSASAA
jgi:4'-phosphopantetheinyl transferase